MTKILLSLNYGAVSIVEDRDGNSRKLRHGDAPVEISEALYNKYKEESSKVILPISNKRLPVVIPKYTFTFIDEDN